MSAAARVEGDPRPSAVSMGALLAAGAAATAVSTPPARAVRPERAEEDDPAPHDTATTEPEAA
jgi:hypothetical protein